MAPSPPPFASSAYWETRFNSNQEAFDWLQPSSALDPHITAALQATCETSAPNVLHIGCGTSLLSYRLRAHVDDPIQIHNVDFSKQAIELGRRREVEIFDDHNWEGEDVHSIKYSSEGVDVSLSRGQSNGMSKRSGCAPPSSLGTVHMRWDTGDLLSLSSLFSICTPASYTLVIDKSTSDAIACADDVPVDLPYGLKVRHTPSNLSSSTSFTFPSSSASSTSSSSRRPESYTVHPLSLLAVHLAAITKPHARWVCVSYSSARFPFLSLSSDNTVDANAESAVSIEFLEQGFPDPAVLWRLERREEVEAPVEVEAGQGVHRPKIVHWVYILGRTVVEVSI